MAPRGRPRKRLGRMDAAVDHMIPYGFDEDVVQKKVKQLLKEYGGDEGWTFIEDDGYIELIEALLRDHTAQQQGVSSQNEKAQVPAIQSSVVPSCTLVDSTCNVDANAARKSVCSEPGSDADEPTLQELCSNKPDIGNSEELCPPSAEGDGNRWKDIGEDQISTQKDEGNANAVSGDDGISRNQVQLQGKSPVVASRPTSSPCGVNHRKFCSGSQVKLGSSSHVSTPPPTPSPCPVKKLKLCSGSQVQSGSSSRVSTRPPTSSPCPVQNHPPPADHHPTTHPGMSPSSKPVNLQPPRKSFPCYGWIESDEEGDADFIQLPPMKPATPLLSQNSSGGTDKREKRKSRWDIRPNDL